ILHSGLIQEYAEANLEAAKELLESQDFGKSKSTWEYAVAKATFGEDSEGFLAHLLEGDDPNKYAIASVVSTIRDKNPDRVWDAVKTIEDPEIRGEVVGRLIPEVLATSPEKAIQSV